MHLPDEECFNVDFVKTVEMYRCLYDVNLEEYRVKGAQERAWRQIAETFGASPVDCKMRWRYLRSGVTRYLKKVKEAGSLEEEKQVKQYYLWDAMQFVVPFLKCNIKKRMGIQFFYGGAGHDDHELVDSEFYDKEEADEDLGDIRIEEIPREEEESLGIDTESVDQLESEGTETKQTSASLNSKNESDKNMIYRGIKRSRSSVDDFCYERVLPSSSSYNSNYSKPDVDSSCSSKIVKRRENPDLDFFRSILPDMSQLNASQKRRFKCKVLETLEDLSNEKTDT